MTGGEANCAHIGGVETPAEPGGVWFSLSFLLEAASCLGPFEDLGLVSRLLRLVVDFVFLGFFRVWSSESFVFSSFSLSLLTSDLKETVLFVLMWNPMRLFGSS